MRTFNRNIALNDVLKNSLPKSIWGKPAMESDLSILLLSFLIYHALHKKWSFPLTISSVNVTKSAGKKSLMENFISCAVAEPLFGVM